MIRLGILGSTRGTSMSALIQAIEQRQLPAQIAVVISNKADAPILQKAYDHGLITEYISPRGLTREEFDQHVSELLRAHEVDLVVLIGYMRILSDAFVAAWENKIINVHPSLLPAFAGKMDLDVHRAVLASGVAETGCTVHYVTAEVDAGPVILQKTCEVYPGETAEELKQRVQNLEGEALVEAVVRIMKSV